ncbi:hypothetical protein BABINDRAFT_8897 [Babjeviella inositovora NRRL Y-12698]|uniref:Uncharacterized protein n=1 Tax=Babjeviella inositovora NRRL Y-12698 TaxID=984486 RepID=A0A1E3QLS0_9ASCO|nr:uncharacterized protein BABINDRAFT_8897 [Babjeviella inositovora NRRL Y-12698]ODQ78646.1 hypothetical protein BABINDRAFT_8897 [Babjeviella inositovora NRRL Y-12698]
MELQRISEDYKLAKKGFLSKNFNKAYDTLSKYFAADANSMFALYEKKSVNLILLNNVLNLYATVINEILKQEDTNRAVADSARERVASGRLLREYVAAVGGDFGQASPEIFYSCYLIEYLNGSGPDYLTRLADKIENEYLSNINVEIYTEAFSKLYQAHLHKLLELYLVHVLPRAAREEGNAKGDAYTREFIENSPYIARDVQVQYTEKLAAKYRELDDKEARRQETAAREQEAAKQKEEEQRAKQAVKKEQSLKQEQIRALKAKLMAENHSEAISEAARKHTVLSESASGAETPILAPEKKPKKTMLQKIILSNKKQLAAVAQVVRARIPQLIVLLVLVLLGRTVAGRKQGTPHDSLAVTVWNKVAATAKMAFKVTYV